MVNVPQVGEQRIARQAQQQVKQIKSRTNASNASSTKFDSLRKIEHHKSNNPPHKNNGRDEGPHMIGSFFGDQRVYVGCVGVVIGQEGPPDVLGDWRVVLVDLDVCLLLGVGVGVGVEALHSGSCGLAL